MQKKNKNSRKLKMKPEGRFPRQQLEAVVLFSWQFSSAFSDSFQSDEIQP